MTETQHSESLSLEPRVRFRAVGDEGVVVHLDSARVIVVNEVGLHVLQALSTPRTRDSLAAMIADDFVVTERRAREDVDVFLAQLEKEQIINIDAEHEAMQK